MPNRENGVIVRVSVAGAGHDPAVRSRAKEAFPEQERDHRWPLRVELVDKACEGHRRGLRLAAKHRRRACGRCPDRDVHQRVDIGPANFGALAILPERVDAGWHGDAVVRVAACGALDCVKVEVLGGERLRLAACGGMAVAEREDDASRPAALVAGRSELRAKFAQGHDRH